MLYYKHHSRRLAEVRHRRTHISSRFAFADQFRIAHLLEPAPISFEIDFITRKLVESILFGGYAPLRLIVVKTRIPCPSWLEGSFLSVLIQLLLLIVS